MPELNSLIRVSFVLFFLLSAGFSHAEVNDISAEADANYQQVIGARELVFYAIDLQSNKHFAYNPGAAEERKTPFSTFKIPNLMIALQTGVATSADHHRVWDANRRPAANYWPETWKKDMTLAEAFRRSAVWYFQDMALKVGSESYRAALKEFSYGNALVPDGSDDFWLTGDLVISPKEQALFLEKLLSNGLPVSAEILNTLHSVSLLEQQPGYSLHGKTGAGPVVSGKFDDKFTGWLIGWVNRTDAAPVVFALHVKGSDFAAINKFRRDMSVHFLQLIN
ncbi:MAG TPA: penicillin-binding transpeptidase domain-containing protein, partial [Cellvibrionaceae bacterium]